MPPPRCRNPHLAVLPPQPAPGSGCSLDLPEASVAQGLPLFLAGQRTLACALTLCPTLPGDASLRQPAPLLSYPPVILLLSPPLFPPAYRQLATLSEADTTLRSGYPPTYPHFRTPPHCHPLPRCPSSVQLATLSEVDTTLRSDYARRRLMMITRAKVTLQSCMWSPRLRDKVSWRGWVGVQGWLGLKVSWGTRRRCRAACGALACGIR